MGVVIQRHAPVPLPPVRHPVPIAQEAGWSSGPDWTCTDNLALNGFDPRTVQPVLTELFRPTGVDPVLPPNHQWPCS